MESHTRTFLAQWKDIITSEGFDFLPFCIDDDHTCPHHFVMGITGIVKSTITRVTKVVEGKPEVRVIPGGETRITKVIQGGPEIKYTRVSTGIGGDISDDELKRRLEEEVTKVSKFIEGDTQLLDDEELKKLLQGEPQVRKVQTVRRIQGPVMRRKQRRSHKS